MFYASLVFIVLLPVSMIPASENHPVNLPFSLLSDSEKTGCYSSCFSSKCTNPFGTGRERRYIPSVSSALVVGGVLGLIQAIFLILAAKLVLNIMGVKSVSNAWVKFPV